MAYAPATQRIKIVVPKREGFVTVLASIGGCYKVWRSLQVLRQDPAEIVDRLTALHVFGHVTRTLRCNTHLGITRYLSVDC